MQDRCASKEPEWSRGERDISFSTRAIPRRLLPSPIKTDWNSWSSRWRGQHQVSFKTSVMAKDTLVGDLNFVMLKGQWNCNWQRKQARDKIMSMRIWFWWVSFLWWHDLGLTCYAISFGWQKVMMFGGWTKSFRRCHITWYTGVMLLLILEM